MPSNTRVVISYKYKGKWAIKKCSVYYYYDSKYNYRHLASLALYIKVALVIKESKKKGERGEGREGSNSTAG
jgi:hypothetical protein